MDRQVKGILGAKLGMTQVWDNNKVVPVTVVQAGPVCRHPGPHPDKDGYAAVQLAFGASTRARSQAEAGHFAKSGAPAPAPGRAAHDRRQRVHARPGGHGRSVRRRPADRRDRQDQGQGLRRRDEAARLPRSAASHGVERKHRSPGSIGACATPGRVFKGVRMAGRMGSVRYTAQGLTIQAVEPEQNLILVRGAIPGPKGGLVLIRTAAKSKAKAGASK
jgi:large subunit ribosomal protein L3